MSITKNQISHYLQETLAVDVAPEIWQPGRRLPIFLRDGYTFYEFDLLGNRCLVMVDKGPDRTAATIRKHIEQVQRKWDSIIIYVRHGTTSDERRRLIEHKIPFMVPGNQMYLPMLGIDLREHFRRFRDEVTTFAPATQAAILLLLNDPKPRGYDTKELAGRLGYSKMTASRILNELKIKGLGIIRLEGRSRQLKFDGDRRAFWQHTLPLLSSPVKHRRHINSGNIGTRAGLTALAAYSMLAGPTIPTMAVTSGQWKKIEKQPDFTPVKATDPDANEIEVWSYDPLLFAKERTCDPYSLFLSLRDTKDERVQSAIEEMMEALPW
ncbi:MAG: hypothetical protein N2C12_05310 [Planctomycetales bacterium]